MMCMVCVVCVHDVHGVCVCVCMMCIVTVAHLWCAVSVWCVCVFPGIAVSTSNV
jgi:hypothetical protein